MPASVRSTTLFYGAISSTSPTTLFTVPPDTTVLVKSVYGHGFGSAAVNLAFLVGLPPAASQIVQVIPVAFASSFSWVPWIALDPGMVFQCYVSAAELVRLIVSGTVLPGAAPSLPGTKPSSS